MPDNETRATDAVTPPNTDLLAWGSVMGPKELVAYARVENALREAVGSGALRPGSRGWKAAAEGLCEHILLGPAPGKTDRSRLSAMFEERVDNWVALAHPRQLRSMRAAVASQIVSAPAAPSDHDLQATTRPMRWLLERCGGGVTLTQSGYLPPDLVREGVELFGWWEWGGQPRSEADVHQIGILRQTASRLRLVTKRGRLLATSGSGIRLLDDPVALWRALAARVGCVDAYTTMMSELIAHRLLHGPAQEHELAETVVPIIEAQDWRSGRARLEAERIRWSIHEPLRDWRLFGLLDEQQSHWANDRLVAPSVISLTTAGKAMALTQLHTRATAPRHDPYG